MAAQQALLFPTTAHDNLDGSACPMGSGLDSVCSVNPTWVQSAMLSNFDVQQQGLQWSKLLSLQCNAARLGLQCMVVAVLMVHMEVEMLANLTVLSRGLPQPQLAHVLNISILLSSQLA